MDGELVSSSPSESSEEDSAESYSERFHIEFPKYLAMGMTPREFWDDDPALARDYRKAQEIKNDETNRKLWLQGVYIYEAISDLAPILQAFAKKGTKAKPYPERPYALTVNDRKKVAKKEEQKQYDKAKQRMMAIALNLNKRFKDENEVSANGNDN